MWTLWLKLKVSVRVGDILITIFFVLGREYYPCFEFFVSLVIYVNGKVERLRQGRMPFLKERRRRRWASQQGPTRMTFTWSHRGLNADTKLLFVVVSKRSQQWMVSNAFLLGSLRRLPRRDVSQPQYDVEFSTRHVKLTTPSSMQRMEEWMKDNNTCPMERKDGWRTKQRPEPWKTHFPMRQSWNQLSELKTHGRWTAVEPALSRSQHKIVCMEETICMRGWKTFIAKAKMDVTTRSSGCVAWSMR